MSYLTTAEEIGIEIGIEKGIEKGLHQGIETMFVEILKNKFGQLPKMYQEKVQFADDATLIHWGKRILNVNALEDVFS